MQTDYWHATDYKSPLRGTINPRMIGTSGAYPKKGMEQLRAKIWEGASVVELGFTGKAKGNLGGGSTTPEMHSKEEREEMREMAKINEVDLSTHTTIGVGGLAGFEQGTFRPEIKEQAVVEIKRTLDFAADVAQGGPVTVHTGEFPRPVAEIEKKEGKPVFEAYPHEAEKAPEYLVDERTGRMISELKKDIEIPVPVWKKEKDEYVDEKGKILKGEEIFDKRVPVMDENTGKVQVEKQGWKYFKEQAERWNAVHPDAKEHLTPGQWAWREQKEAEIKQSKSNEVYYLNFYNRTKKQLESLENTHADLEEAEKLPEKAKREVQMKILEGAAREGISPEALQNFDKSRNLFKDEMEGFRAGVTSAAQRIKQVEMDRDNAVTLEKYGVEQSADALSRSAIYAYDKERTMKLKKPLFVAPENVFPETYGAHPQELKNLILKSREKMANELHDQRGITRSEARKIADEHIKATYDVAHANTWKKFFKAKSGETSEQTDERFKTWMKNQVEDLQKKGIIGHVHISDNFGYYDEHLEPGQGNTPIKELAEKLKKDGYKGKFIAEWGAQPEAQSFKAMTGAWKTLSSPAYRIDTMGTSWSDIESSYFGRTGSPTYLVGDTAPSKDWSFWSETPME